MGITESHNQPKNCLELYKIFTSVGWYRYWRLCMHETETIPPASRRRLETRMFIFLVVFLFPILAVMVVGGYGFVVWIAQIFFGPPGPPA